MRVTVYLAGEIHTSWRAEIKSKSAALNLPIDFVGPMEDHERSDNIGEEILGVQPSPVCKDAAASNFNNLRTELMMKKADLVIALFDDQYKQWNTAMDAGAAAALGKPLILIRPEAHHHALKELSRKAQATVENCDQAIKALRYIFE